MTIRRLVYVACDQCGNPIGGSESMGDDAKEARSQASWLGAVRVRRDGKMIDLCKTCAAAAGVAK
jgi:hypothetical protein